MDGDARQHLHGCGRKVDNEPYLELDHRMARSEGANQGVHSRGPIYLETLDADDTRKGNRRESVKGERRRGSGGGQGMDGRMRQEDIKQAIRDAEPVHRCWAPTGRRQCGKKCIRSHTVQRSLLEKMARDHKVYSTRWKRMIGKGGRVVDRDSKRPELVATRQAGIMRLLCGEHDREMFAALETERFEASYEQLAQLVLRGALQERHDGEFARNAERANPHVPKVRDTEDMQKRLRAETAAYSPRRIGKWEMDGLVIELEGTPKVMGGGAFLAEKGEDAIDCVGWGTGAEDGRWWMCLATRVSAAGAGSAMLDEWMEGTRHEGSGFLLSRVFHCFDNVYMSPDWWEALPETTREAARRVTNIDAWENILNPANALNPPRVEDWGEVAVQSVRRHRRKAGSLRGRKDSHD